MIRQALCRLPQSLALLAIVPALVACRAEDDTDAAAVITPVTFSLNSLFELKAEQTNVTVAANTSITALTTLDLSFVSSGITQAMLNSAAISSGKILISASSNSNLYNIIINNLQEFHHVDVSPH